MARPDYDAIIVGGGHNGLTCGAYLARAGKRVLVLEQKGVVGGAAVTEEFVPGFSASTYSFIMGHLHPKVIAELELVRHGLSYINIDSVANPTDDDCIVFTTQDPEATRQQIARFSRHDAENYPKFFAELSSTVKLMRRLQLETPINPFDRSPSGLLKTARFAWNYRGAEQEVYNLVSALSMSAHDYVSRWFESDIVKAKFMFWATIGGNVGPYSPGTAFYIVSHLVGQNGMCFPKGGMGAISQAIARSGESHGMRIRTSARVEEILVRDNRARGVRLAGGEEISARAVISNVSAKLTFNGLVARKHLPEDFTQRIDHFRARGMGFKLLCAVDSLPRYKGFDAEKCGIEYPGYAHICPNPEFLEKAFDEAKYGWYSSEPFLSPSVASYFDPSLAPEGKHIVTFQGGVTPYKLKNGDWDHERDALVRNAVRVMDRFAPGFSDSIIDYKLYLPKDIEDDISMPGGSTQHGELTLDQLFFMRPVPGYANYRSPVAALYQCGASTHPGGAVSAVNGHNAAREILGEWKRL
jgi:phytoene dehydrogenase-like protein